MDNETWLLDRGDELLQKQSGGAALTAVETTILIVWEVDYCMRNAGDLANMEDMRPDFLAEGSAAARGASLPATAALFAHTIPDLERDYFAMFDAICAELAQT